MQNKRKLFLLIGGFLISFVIFFIIGFLTTSTFKAAPQPTPSAAVAEEKAKNISGERYSYRGEEGKNALVLLQERAEVEQDSSGLVIRINERAADAGKREFWAFYVNGAMSQVGPADYVAKDKDAIEWRIEKY